MFTGNEDWNNTNLETYENGRQRCSNCEDTMDADMPRLNIGYPGRYGGEKRICGMCIMELAGVISARIHAANRDAED